MELIKTIEAEQLKDNPVNFRIGDTVKVHFKIIEGQTERIQVFEGIVLSVRKPKTINGSILVRKISHNNVGVEKIFPLILIR